MEKVTRNQKKAILKLIDDLGISRRQLQDVQESGILADALMAKVAKVNRNKVRQACGLKPLRTPVGLNIIDLDAAPFIPEGWEVVSHRQGGQIEWNADNVSLFLSSAQKESGGSIVGNDLREIVEGKVVLNANALDWLLAHPEKIPKFWEDKAIFFWGTIYRGGGRLLGVRFLYRDGSHWDWGNDWLDDRWFSDGPAAVLRE
jgi:hypothetical protein